MARLLADSKESEARQRDKVPPSVAVALRLQRRSRKHARTAVWPCGRARTSTAANGPLSPARCPETEGERVGSGGDARSTYSEYSPLQVGALERDLVKAQAELAGEKAARQRLEGTLQNTLNREGDLRQARCARQRRGVPSSTLKYPSSTRRVPPASGACRGCLPLNGLSSAVCPLQLVVCGEQREPCVSGTGGAERPPSDCCCRARRRSRGQPSCIPVWEHPRPQPRHATTRTSAICDDTRSPPRPVPPPHCAKLSCAAGTFAEHPREARCYDRRAKPRGAARSGDAAATRGAGTDPKRSCAQQRAVGRGGRARSKARAGAD
jgi:hypothetical protein